MFFELLFRLGSFSSPFNPIFSFLSLSLFLPGKRRPTSPFTCIHVRAGSGPELVILPLDSDTPPRQRNSVLLKSPLAAAADSLV